MLQFGLDILQIRVNLLQIGATITSRDNYYKSRFTKTWSNPKFPTDLVHLLKRYMEKEAMFEPVFFLSLINVNKAVVCPHLLEKFFEEIKLLWAWNEIFKNSFHYYHRFIFHPSRKTNARSSQVQRKETQFDCVREVTYPH